MTTQPSIQWLLIDIGDVLLLKDRGVRKSFNELIAHELGIDIELAQLVNKEHYTTMEAKYISEDDFISALRNKLGYTAPTDIYKHFENAYREQVTPNIEFLSFLKDVRAAGVNTAVLSNTIAIYKGIQEELGISESDGFSPILYSWQLEMTKPNKDIFQYALNKLGVPAEEILFIDDKQGHLDGAASVGMQTLLFEKTDDATKTIKKLLGI